MGFSCWQKKLQVSLQRHGFKELLSDPCIYFKTTTADLVPIAIYDILVAAKDKDTVAEIKNMLAQEYTVVIKRYLRKTQ
jgi:hypothetical protein